MILPPMQTSDWFRKAAMAVNYLLAPDIIRMRPSAQPSDPQEGWIYMDSTTHKLRVYDGTAWQNCW